MKLIGETGIACRGFEEVCSTPGYLECNDARSIRLSRPFASNHENSNDTERETESALIEHELNLPLDKWRLRGTDLQPKNL
jgi:hypothetical protein